MHLTCPHNSGHGSASLVARGTQALSLGALTVSRPMSGVRTMIVVIYHHHIFLSGSLQLYHCEFILLDLELVDFTRF